MESQAAFVRSDGAVHLNPVPAIDLHYAVPVHPRHAKDDDALRLGHPFENLRGLVLRIFFDERPDRFGDLAHGLVKFSLGRIASPELLQKD